MDISRFSRMDFLSALKALFADLQVPVNYLTDEPTSARNILKDTWKDNAAFGLIKDVYFLGMVDDAAFAGNKSPDASQIQSDYDGVLIFGITLHERENSRLPTRSQLAEITRAFNREYYYTPVTAVFHYSGHLAFASAERLKYRQEWREGEKAGRVSLLRDIDITNPHAGHVRILHDLKIPDSGKNKVDSFAKLYAFWQDVFSVSILSKKFYQELSNWYFWAVREARFPSEPAASVRQEHNAMNIIRLLTRFLFVWFVKEKHLIPEELFDADYLDQEIVKKISPDKADTDSVYYRAIVQNLFFASLNCPIEPCEDGDTRRRGFRSRDHFGQHRDANYLMRYRDLFRNPEKFVELINSMVPFLNGGLFECLDNKTDNIYIDGFSDNLVKPHQLIVPDFLFFGSEQETDLSGVTGIKTKAFENAKVRGLVPLLASYKFTLAENTPIEEDVALDPELLGKVFENLLAAYNPETKTTARKQTGSFYTPREIVSYMVDESLIAYLKNSLQSTESNGQSKDALDTMLHELLSYDPANPFAENRELEEQMIDALDNCRIFDPACGSGAFPMGILQKMVHILQKLDPDNEYWKKLQKEKAEKETKGVFSIADKKAREQKLIEINEAFDEKINAPDYARKLFLTENCIFGVDIQPIAVQISKLRFFISLVVDQKVDKSKPNFGILALPNLETRFAAANTLIGIEKPKDQINIFDNREIKALEEELKDARHRLFSAKSPAAKRRLRDKDKQIREKIGNLLEKHGWGNETAQQLAKWDPYNQNISSIFFDPEWMFGIRDGFDIVIGNPPYVSTRTKDFDRTLLPLYKEIFKLAVGQFDLYNLFFEKSEQCLNGIGTLSFIVPKRLLSNENFKSLRELLINKLPIHKYLDAEMPFESAVVEANVVICQRAKTKTVKVFSRSDKEFIFDKSIDYDSIKKFPFRIFPFANSQRDIQILEEINSVADRSFGDYLIITRGFECGFNHPSISFNGEDFIVRGENIKQYKIVKPDIKVTPDFKNQKIFKSPEIFKKIPKLLTKFVSNTLEFAMDDYGYYNTNVIYNIHGKNKNCNLYEFLLLGNSKLLNYWFFHTYINDDSVFPHIQKNQLESIPVASGYDSSLVSFFGYALNLKYIHKIHKVADAIVFNIYFHDHMKEHNIDILQFVEKDLQEVMQGREFNQLTDDQKENIINRLHAKWTDPESEIVKRMNSFAEKSPDILKPILESR